MNSLHGSTEQSDNVLPPHDNGGVPHYANLSGLGEGMQLHPYAHSSLQCSLDLPSGFVDAMLGHHWQGHLNDTSATMTSSNRMQVGLDMSMGYPMPRSHVAMADCLPFTLG
ncbi:hypothetical protein GOP47_0007744 [Adiantum capillus-veneris]|uniref:Uncharacterized protein n=1 Tax=Adiantum capillus-veneris TaxID=13818 RepID=A0A9D4ZM93_ADICA|nr:hypothetical protein GOP47_0007744 [Adiantum capillus-veneris]